MTSNGRDLGRPMSLILGILQTAAALTVAGITAAAALWWEGGELAKQLMKRELAESTVTIANLEEKESRLKRQMAELNAEKEQIQQEREEVIVQREAAIQLLTIAALELIWRIGLEELRNRYADARVLGEWAKTKRIVDEWRKWEEGQEAPTEEWARIETRLGASETYDEWGRALLELGRVWECSKHDGMEGSRIYGEALRRGSEAHKEVIRRSKTQQEWSKWYEAEKERIEEWRVGATNRAKQNEHVDCLREWEQDLRESESTVWEPQTVKGMVESWIERSELDQHDKEVKNRLMDRLTLSNGSLGGQQLHIILDESSTPEEIEEQVRQLRLTLDATRRWLDTMTQDRIRWRRKSNED